MSKPVQEVVVSTIDGRTGSVRALFDTGAYRSIIRENCLPSGAQVIRTREPQELRTAAQGGKLFVTGATVLTVTIGSRMIQTDVLVSPDLSQEMLIGSGTMQGWDITIQNRNGHTEVLVGRDLRDPDVQEVD